MHLDNWVVFLKMIKFSKFQRCSRLNPKTRMMICRCQWMRMGTRTSHAAAKLSRNEQNGNKNGHFSLFAKFSHFYFMPRSFYHIIKWIPYIFHVHAFICCILHQNFLIFLIFDFFKLIFRLSILNL